MRPGALAHDRIAAAASSSSARHFEDATLTAIRVRVCSLARRLRAHCRATVRAELRPAADPFSFATEPFLQALDRHYPGSTEVGGLASGECAAPGDSTAVRRTAASTPVARRVSTLDR